MGLYRDQLLRRLAEPPLAISSKIQSWSMSVKRRSLTETRSEAPGYFLIGDDRDDSTDSRQFGRVTAAQISRKAVAIVASEAARKIGLAADPLALRTD